jgi:hypothetical protein
VFRSQNWHRAFFGAKDTLFMIDRVTGLEHPVAATLSLVPHFARSLAFATGRLFFAAALL